MASPVEITGTKPTRPGAAIPIQEEDNIGDNRTEVPAPEDNGLAIGEGEHTPHQHRQQADGGFQIVEHGNGGNGQTSTTTRGSTGEEPEHDHVDLMRMRGSSSSTPLLAHPSDVQALAGGYGSTKTGDVENRLGQHPQKPSTDERSLETRPPHFTPVCGGRHERRSEREHAGGENTANRLVKEAVLRQILQHTLSIHVTGADECLITLAEEELETLQALLDADIPAGDQRPPLTRNLAGSREEHVREEASGGFAHADCPEPGGRASDTMHPMIGANGGGEDTWLSSYAVMAMGMHYVSLPVFSLPRWGGH